MKLMAWWLCALTILWTLCIVLARCVWSVYRTWLSVQ